ncbi:small acid-soluble spore protein Tlp [Desulfitobacterium sp.]|uniref:small acid-soluble spore protein Tlp n=1 Tax=Desulfitobacterium sp. TaxID=49981 RepID=UPI002B1FC702|nr:small acid-soluble spore protein Tlp [Desulfitobacterium sp.]MEA4899990.1 small acid-soluble spore protein Tlp [Desulfitobacterium sp.]
MAKPDNRADNEIHLQQHINHTLDNLHEAEEYLEEYSDEITSKEKRDIEVKNEHRKESINAFIDEKRDESQG